MSAPKDFASPGGAGRASRHVLHRPRAAGAQPVGPVGGLDDGRTGHPERGGRADRLPFPRPRPQYRHGTGRTRNFRAVPRAHRRTATRRGPRERHRRRRQRHGQAAAAATSSSASAAPSPNAPSRSSSTIPESRPTSSPSADRSPNGPADDERRHDQERTQPPPAPQARALAHLRRGHQPWPRMGCGTYGSSSRRHLLLASARAARRPARPPDGPSLVAPTIGAVTPGRCSSQASATCAAGTPRAAATSATRSTTSKSAGSA